MGKIGRKTITTNCTKCGKEITIDGYDRKNFIGTGKAYCSPSCSSAAKMGAFLEAGKEARKDPTWRKRSSERMKMKNPMWMPGIKEKMIESSRGRVYFTTRGGNGQITGPQIVLHDATGLSMEYPVLTSPVKHIYPDAPYSYKVDLADIRTKLAIEVDGESHSNPHQKSLDAKKTEILNSLGWTVLRFTNDEVNQNLNACVQIITSTISKLKTTTTIS
jgi:hypothetical protein